MTCYCPLKAFRGVEKHPSGKPVLTFNPLKAINSTNPITLPCQQCIGCRIDRSESIATRCMREARMYEHTSGNAFITLTYDKEHLPSDYSVKKREWQLFMKRLRYETKARLRLFACGEYGDLNLRPHYHALIFGYDFRDDRKFKMVNKDGDRLYTSATLEKAWPYGMCDIGSVTYKSAGYVAQYCVKKIGGDEAARHYLRTHPDSGAVVQVQPEFALSSRRPGLGSAWFDKFKSDAFPSDFLVIDGRHKPVPRYYLLKLKEEEQQKLQRKRKLRSAAPAVKANKTTERLRVRETVKKSRLSRLKRTL